MQLHPLQSQQWARRLPLVGEHSCRPGCCCCADCCWPHSRDAAWQLLLLWAGGRHGCCMQQAGWWPSCCCMLLQRMQVRALAAACSGRRTASPSACAAWCWAPNQAAVLKRPACLHAPESPATDRPLNSLATAAAAVADESMCGWCGGAKQHASRQSCMGSNCTHSVHPAAAGGCGLCNSHPLSAVGGYISGAWPAPACSPV